MSKLRYLKEGFAGGLLGMILIAAWLGGHHSSVSKAAGRKDTDTTAIQPRSSEPAPTPVLQQFRSVDATAADRELLELARKVVERSPSQAIRWARMQHDVRLRQRLLRAVAQAWGEIAPKRAVDWALAQSEDMRKALTDAALSGAFQTQPSAALQIAHHILSETSAFGEDCIGSLLSRFSVDGHFETAAQLAGVAPDDFRADWLSSVFHAWGQAQPKDAMQALESVQDSKLHDRLFRDAVGGWSADDPSSLASYAITLSSGKDRNLAMVKALDNWALQDPAAMADWLSEHPDIPEYDFGSTILLLKSDGANRDIPTALGWAGTIRNEELRLIALNRIVREWATTDPSSAKQYVKKSTSLSLAERKVLLDSLSSSRPIDLTATD